MNLQIEQNILIFDVDGTLLDTDDKFVECIRLTLSAKLGRSVSQFEVQSKMASRFPDLFANFGITKKEDLCCCIEQFVQYWKQSELHIKLYPGIYSLLEDCQALGIKMVVWSARDILTVEDSLRDSGIGGFFQDVFCYSHESGGKPVPESKLRRMVRLAGGRCALIGDSEVDLKAAQEIQVQFFGALWKTNATIADGYATAENIKGDLFHYFRKETRCTS